MINDTIKTLQWLEPGSYLAQNRNYVSLQDHPCESSWLSSTPHKMGQPALVWQVSMGLKSSCAIFEKFSTSLQWLPVHYLKGSVVLHILDDFLFIA